jgi:Flp pilus assembly protein TadG
MEVVMKVINNIIQWKSKRNTEQGQVVILMAFALVALLGFTSLAIDGGMLYADRRAAQNAADAAAFTGILKKAQGLSNAQAIAAALDNASVNGYDSSQVNVEVWSQSDITGNYDYVSVEVTSTTRTAFLHFVYNGEAGNRVIAVTKVRAAGPAMPQVAIVAMDDCTTGSGPLLSITGGGNSGGVLTYNGGMFLNSPEPSGSGHCAIDPPSSAQTWGIRAYDGYQIWSVGSHAYNGETTVSPVPIQYGFNSGQPISDPLAVLPEPVCSSNGSVSGNQFQPGNFNGSTLSGSGIQTFTFAPGIYCINGDVTISGNRSWAGDGVVLYFTNGALSFRGNGNLNLTAPNESNCLGQDGDPTASCTFKGVVFYSSRSNTNTLDVRGNGDIKITGLVYALNGRVEGKGGGADPDEWVVKGQIIAGSVAGDGNGSFVVSYDADNTYHLNTLMNLER